MCIYDVVYAKAHFHGLARDAIALRVGRVALRDMFFGVSVHFLIALYGCIIRNARLRERMVSLIHPYMCGFVCTQNINYTFAPCAERAPEAMRHSVHATVDLSVPPLRCKVDAHQYLFLSLSLLVSRSEEKNARVRFGESAQASKAPQPRFVWHASWKHNKRCAKWWWRWKTEDGAEQLQFTLRC